MKFEVGTKTVETEPVGYVKAEVIGGSAVLTVNGIRVVSLDKNGVLHAIDGSIMGLYIGQPGEGSRLNLSDVESNRTTSDRGY